MFILIYFFWGGEKKIQHFLENHNLIKFDQICFFLFSQEKNIDPFFLGMNHYEEILGGTIQKKLHQPSLF